MLALLTVLGGGAAYSAIEKVDPDGDPLSAWDRVSWALTTVTTVGYGDHYPAKTGGRIIAIVVMAVGIGFVAIITAAAAERFMASRREVEEERADLDARLDEIARRLEAIEPPALVVSASASPHGSKPHRRSGDDSTALAARRQLVPSTRAAQPQTENG